MRDDEAGDMFAAMPADGLDARRARIAGAAIFAVALGLRVLAARRFGLIEHDGAYYADLARTLLTGDFTRGWSTVWPPLEPIGIAALARLARAGAGPVGPELLESCARALSVACGVALLIPFYSLARTLLSRPLAFVALAFLAVHARLVQYSGAALTEAPFTLALVAAVAAWSRGRIAWAGACFAIAFLARPEGLLLGLLVWITSLLLGWAPGPRAKDSQGTRALRSFSGMRLSFLATLALISAPYAVFVSLELGRPSLGEKGDYNFWRAHREASARHFADPVRLEDRVGDIPSIARATGDREFDPLSLVRQEPGRVLARTGSNLARILVSSYPVALHPVFALMALLGAWRLPVRRWRWVLLLLAAFPLLYAPFSIDRRFFVPAIPFALLLAARGAWSAARALARMPRIRLRRSTWTFGLAVVIALGQVAYVVFRVKALDQAPELRAAGLWLRAHGPRHPIVEARGPWVGFYADGASMKLPESDARAAVERARRRGANVLVVDARSMRRSGSRLATLLDPANAPPGLAFLHRIARPESVVIYAVEASPGVAPPSVGDGMLPGP